MESMFHLLESHTLILTPNRRLSAHLQKSYNTWQQASQKTCWPTLDVLPFHAFLQRSWNELSHQLVRMPLPLLLTSNQELVTWENIIKNSPHSENLLQSVETAEAAKKAWDLLQQWQVDIHHADFHSIEDYRIFQEWAIQFQTLCNEQHYLANSSLCNYLIEMLKEHKLTLPSKIIMHGFTELTPQQTRLLELLEKQSIQVIHYQPDVSASPQYKIKLLDEETEILNMARWAKKLYDDASDKTNLRIACIVPRLENLREKILAIFSAVFSEKNAYTLDPILLPFNISAGKSLLSYSIIQMIFKLLTLPLKEIGIETWSHILRSPFIGHAEAEQAQRSKFELRLYQFNIHQIALDNLLDENEIFQFKKICPTLYHHLSQFTAKIKTLHPQYHPSEWALQILQLLETLGWPGERSLNSEEYQVTQRWLNLLVEFQTFDELLGPISLSTCLHYLKLLAKKTIFQIQTPDAPIQILGVLEAADSPFDYSWLMGMDDTHWPPRPEPNPFIPKQLQKNLSMPHATAERELQYCQTLLTQLHRSTQYFILSYPSQCDDMELAESALLNPINEISLADLSLSGFNPVTKTLLSCASIVTLKDEIAPKIEKEENIRGGIAIFKHQAACPFRAYAEIRLFARSVDSPTMGLRSLERGNVVHKALELFWQRVQDSKNLHQLSAFDLDETISQAASTALNMTIKNKKSARYLQLELQRLKKILQEWIALEKKRPPFAVAEQEFEIETSMHDFTIKLRVDRIDQLEDGHYILIDYKTGKYNEIKKWFGERPDEPQLPLYCITEQKPFVGIAFGQLHPDCIDLKGISKHDVGISSIKLLEEIRYTESKQWDLQLQDWRTHLTNLALEFATGIATVQPKNANETCEQCDLQSFCRINEMNRNYDN